MNPRDDRWIALQNLLTPADAQLSIDENMSRWNTVVAALMKAERATITLAGGSTLRRGAKPPPGDLDAAREALATEPPAPTRRQRRLSAPILVDGEPIGHLWVSGPQAKPGFDDDDRNLLGVLALLIGQMVQAGQLRAILLSRFAQIAVAQAAENAVAGTLQPGSYNPAQVARMLGKSFCREMAGAGFSIQQIINAATEIIAEVSGLVEKHKRRRDRAAEVGKRQV